MEAPPSPAASGVSAVPAVPLLESVLFVAEGVLEDVWVFTTLSVVSGVVLWGQGEAFGLYLGRDFEG